MKVFVLALDPCSSDKEAETIENELSQLLQRHKGKHVPEADSQLTTASKDLYAGTFFRSMENLAHEHSPGSVFMAKITRSA